MKKKITAVILSMMLLLSIFPLEIIAAQESSNKSAIIAVEKNFAMAGQTVDIKVNIENNPGLLGAILSFSYDSRLILKGASKGEAFAELNMTKPGSFTSPCSFVWDGQDSAAKADGNILTLTFEVADGVEANEFLNVGVTYAKNEIVDANLNPIDIVTSNGGISVINYIPGDATGDGIITTLDVTMIRRFKAGGYSDDAPINEAAADVNDDGSITTADITLIRRYIAGGYDVVLKPSTPKCDHVMTKVPEIKATCTEDGRIGYWHCSVCDKYFADAEGTMEMNLDSTVVKATGHTIVIDEAVAPTYTQTGLTEGKHCGVCGEVLIAPVEVPKLVKNEYVITYYISNNDSYLKSLYIENPNPAKYSSEDGVVLKDIIVEGYNFVGWFTAQTGGTQVTKINAGETGAKDLYAHWEKVKYTVQYKSDIFVEKSKEYYTVDEGLVLPTPTLSNYVFTGWTDEYGKLYQDKTIPVGTTGNITLTANWTSERNKTFTKPKLDEPIIVEDEETNTIFFTYEIGEIQNIPLYTVHDFGYINGDGITKTHTETYTTKISETAMNAYAKSVANATTKSSDWTLSNGWTESTSLNEESYTEKGLTEEQAKVIAMSDTNTWNISSGTSGSTSTTSTTTNQDGWTNQAKVNLQNSKDVNVSATHKEVSNNEFEINGKLTYTPKSYNVGVKVGDIGVDAGVSGGLGWELGAGYKHEWGSEDTTSIDIKKSQSSGFEAGTSREHSTLSSNSSNSTASWNSSLSKGGSSTCSASESTSQIISQKIASTYGYGKEYIQSGNQSESQGLSSTESSGEEYSSSVTYSKGYEETITDTWTTQATKAGYHRWVMVGNAHVFAVVGYNMAEKSYFVYTYSVMDDEAPKPFEDYSYVTGNYNDMENGVIPFEVPYEVAEYVAERTCYSDGLKINQSTGIITAYTGDDDCVVIPEYMNVGNGKVVKVTGISENAFKGNTKIKAVDLSDYIEIIPDHAFEGCTSLIGLSGGSVYEIGKEAFKDCISIEVCCVDNSIKSLGNNAFSGCETLLVNVANSNIAKAAVDSGAKNIQMYVNGKIIENGTEAFRDITLAVPYGTKLFVFSGYGYEYPGLSIHSNAESTAIHRTNFNETDEIALKIESSDVALNEVNVNSNGIGIVLLNDNVNLFMQDNIKFFSKINIPMLCKNTVLGEYNDRVDGMLTVNEKLYVCGDVEGTTYLAKKGEEIEYITEEEYESKLHSCKVTFNSDGGSTIDAQIVDRGAKVVKPADPTKDKYKFIGWYTDSALTNEWNFDNPVKENITLYAKWKLNEFTVTFDANGGSVSPASLKVVYGNAYSELPVPNRTGFNFDGWYTAKSGGTKITSATTFTSEEAQTLYAHWTVKNYKVSWNTGTGYSITVSRTSSPNAGASTGNLANNSTIYYGDVLKVSYSATTGYTLGSTGSKDITVTGNVTSGNIYASATANNYTYNIRYVSSNGTYLGSSTATYKYGTTNTIYPQSFNGYTTPSSQSVAWDWTSTKTITFTFTPNYVSDSQHMGSGGWWYKNGAYRINYNVSLQYQNRTANSIQVRAVWTNTLSKNYYYGYAQSFSVHVNGIDSGAIAITQNSTWASNSGSERSVTVASGWITVPVSATTTSVQAYGSWWDANYSGSVPEVTFHIPAY